MGEHARLSPSAAERWWNCPASVRLSDEFEDETSDFAAEGTCAHEIRERCLNKGTDVREYVGEWLEADGFKFQVETDWAHYLQPGIDWIREQKMTWVFELRVDLSTWMPGQFGTLDAGGYNDELIVINDLKFGRGFIVDAERNKQMMIYALGFWDQVARHHTKAKRFLLMIDQPRGQGAGGGSEWEVSLDELLKFGEELVHRARRTEDIDAPAKVTPKGCHFCLVAKNAACPELHNFMLKMSVGLGLYEFDLTKGFNLITTDRLSPEDRSAIIEHKALFNKWLQGVHDLHLSEAIAGAPTPGFKAVETVGDRDWVDPEEAERFLTEKTSKKDAFNFKLKSPAQAERILGTRNWKKAESMIVRRPGKPALVPVSDARPAIQPIVELFDDESEFQTEIPDDLQDLI